VTGPLLALAASLSWGLGDFLAGLRARRLPVLTVLVVSQAAGVTTIALVVAVRGEGPPSEEHLGYAVLAGAAGAVGLAALYRGLAVGSMSVVAPISATAAIVPVVFGVLTGERPSPAQGLGIALAVVGVVLASRSRGLDGRGRAVAEGAGLALVAALAFGLLLVALGEASEGDALWATLGMRAASFSLVVVTAFVLRPSFALAERDLSVLVLIGILDTAGNALFALATTESLLSLVAVLGQLYPVVTVLLARILLGERLSPVQGTGVVGAFAGVALITAG
jgi:drug/metabolite transporter (DMT)-like permease